MHNAEKIKNRTYLIFVDHRFDKLAESEIKQILPKSKLIPYKVQNNKNMDTIFFKLSVKDISNDISEKIENSNLSFVDFILPIDIILDEEKIDYKSIESSIMRIIKKNQLFKLEVKKVDRLLSESAKSIEVNLGNDLEYIGYNIDLIKPTVIIYIIILKKSIMIGHVNVNTQNNYTLDIFRESNKEGIIRLNRAEFKIKEAVQFFGLNLSKYKLGLDIGAAPGGWTNYLSQQGIRMVAVDKTRLDYKKIGNNKRILVLTDDEDLDKTRAIIKEKNSGLEVAIKHISEKLQYNEYDIIHIKTSIDINNKTKIFKNFEKFDLLTIDTNTSPLESTAIVNSLTELLNKNASLIMTTKLVTKDFNKHINTIKKELYKNFKNIKIKKLPHNRREFTVYGTYNGNNK